MTKPKYKYEWEVQVHYGYGWECVTTEDHWLDAKEQIKTYRENEIGIPFRLKKVRINNEQ